MPKPSPAPAITPGEQRIELQLEGFRSVVSGGFLSLGQCLARMEVQLERIADALERQNKFLERHTNGHDDAPEGDRP